MSRNLASTMCQICGALAERIAFDEEPRIATVDDIPAVFFENYIGLIVAKAHCADCDAKYLAWVDAGTNVRINSGHWRRDAGDERRFIDLSFRSSFNDEPDADDLPTPEKLQRLHHDECMREHERWLANAEEHMRHADDARRRAHAPSHWESYRR